MLDDKSSLQSIQLERHVLGGLLKHEEIFPEVDSILDDQCFTTVPHRTLYQLIKQILQNGGEIDKVVLSEKVKGLGISFGQDISAFEYIDEIAACQINKSGARSACEDLIKKRVQRDLFDLGENIKKIAKRGGEKNSEEIIASCEKVFGEQVNAFTTDNEPQDLFKDLDELIMERAKQPTDEVGLKTPYPEFNRLYGGLRGGNVYAFVSRAKHGKSTILNDIVRRTAEMNDCKALVLDTEMTVDENKFRHASSITKVPVWWLESGNFASRDEFRQEYEQNKRQFTKYNDRVFHLNVAGTPITRVCSIIRRWYYKHVGMGKKAIVVYDYVKLTGEKTTEAMKEYQVIGEKINHLKQLSLDLDFPLLTACQLNRSAEDGRDDSAAISLSDRLQWFASGIWIFRRNRTEEVEEIGKEFGTHRMIELATRFQGKDAQGHNSLVQIRTGTDKKGRPKYEYRPYYINFQVDNFAVEERGTIMDVIKKENEKFDVQTSNEESKREREKAVEL